MLKRFFKLFKKEPKQANDLSKIPFNGRTPQFTLEYNRKTCILTLTYTNGYIDKYKMSPLKWRRVSDNKKCGLKENKFLNVIFSYTGCF